jgi:hypothetical protein
MQKTKPKPRPEWPALLSAARAENNARDKIDRAHGMAPPAACGPKEIVRTAMSAMEAGYASDDWKCVAEAYAMLEELAK